MLFNIVRHRRSKSSVPPTTNVQEASTKYQVEGGEPSCVSHTSDNSVTFWPGDLLPAECPDARILTWGYDTLITRGLKTPADKTNIFAHGKKLLFALGRKRDTKRPIIFVAHSLGGIVVKEMLASSHMAEDEDLKDIAKSTAAVVFIGTPHRGSKDMASVGEVARKAASIILDTSSTSLDTLGLKTTDLERCQEAFSRLWRANDFRVKTFQESTGIIGLNAGLLNEKVVPDISSTLGDSREQAEVLVGNHMQICRMSGQEDPNYDSLVGELRRMYNSISKLSDGARRTMSEASPRIQDSNGDHRAQYQTVDSGAF
ncbi:hypothetical protein N7540_003273 [Penicillium herquei]|nr:hypothetical protein N7540_003273 [Penicillium herquei]